MNKRIFPNELAYVIAMISVGFGTAFMEAADFGVSMVVAPAYLIYLKVSEFLPFFTFGMAEYTLQAVLLLITAVVMRRFKVSYLFSFVTAVIYGVVLDGCIFLIDFIPTEHVAVRLVFFALGLLGGSFGVSLFFRTYISPQAYELFVKEASNRFHIDIHRFKTGFDCTSCLIGVLLSFAFFGLWHFEGVKIGTVVCALLNGLIIGTCTKIEDRLWRFEDKLPWRRFFEK